MPRLRSIPISRVRSKTFMLSVLMTPSAATSIVMIDMTSNRLVVWVISRSARERMASLDSTVRCWRAP